jgi:hypothetical protein
MPTWANAAQLRAMDTPTLKTYMTTLDAALSAQRAVIAQETDFDSTEFAGPGSIDPAKAVAANAIPQNINAVKVEFTEPVSALSEELVNRYGVQKFPKEFPSATDYTFITDTIQDIKTVLTKI